MNVFFITNSMVTLYLLKQLILLIKSQIMNTILNLNLNFNFILLFIFVNFQFFNAAFKVQLIIFDRSVLFVFEVYAIL